MKALMWLGIVGAITISLLIACVPGPATAVAHAAVQDLPAWASQPNRLCDDRGVCCYTLRSGGISCVATKIIIISGEITNEGDNEFPPTILDRPQGYEAISGEVASPALEARLLRDYRFQPN